MKSYYANLGRIWTELTENLCSFAHFKHFNHYFLIEQCESGPRQLCIQRSGEFFVAFTLTQCTTFLSSEFHKFFFPSLHLHVSNKAHYMDTMIALCYSVSGDDY